MVEIDRRQRHASKTAIRMIDPARDRHDPFAAGTALYRRSNVRPKVGMVTVVNEIFTVRVVGAPHFGAVRIDDPAPVFVINEQAVDLTQFIALGAEQALQAIQLPRPDALVFQAINQPEQQRIGLFD